MQQWIQAASGKALYGFNVLLSSADSPATLGASKVWLPGWSEAINNNSNSLFLTIGPGDFLVHHAIALAFTHNNPNLSKRCIRRTWFKINAR